MIRYRAHAVDTDKLDVTIQFTMPLGEWKQLLDNIEQSWPGCDVRMAIREAIHEYTMRVEGTIGGTQ